MVQARVCEHEETSFTYSALQQPLRLSVASNHRSTLLLSILLDDISMCKLGFTVLHQTARERSNVRPLVR